LMNTCNWAIVAICVSQPGYPMENRRIATPHRRGEQEYTNNPLNPVQRLFLRERGRLRPLQRTHSHK
jgi:hypothetical protein